MDRVVSDAVRASLGVAADEVFYKGKGCRLCYDTGYAGRAAAYELLVINPELRSKIGVNCNAIELEKLAIEGGMVPLTSMALNLARQKVTSLEEVFRVKLY